MTGPTHRQYSIFVTLIAAIIIYRLGLTEINYYLAIPILLLASGYGTLFPDVDHDWKNVKEKNIFNWVINKLIHLTGGRHRSWQTHSIDIVVLVVLISYYLPNILYVDGVLSKVNKEVLNLLLLGFSSGWASHIFSDMLTSGGVRLFSLSRRKVALVPRQLLGFRFNTGNEWELFNYRTIKLLNISLWVVSLAYPSIHSGILGIK